MRRYRLAAAIITVFVVLVVGLSAAMWAFRPTRAGPDDRLHPARPLRRPAGLAPEAGRRQARQGGGDVSCQRPAGGRRPLPPRRQRPPRGDAGGHRRGASRAGGRAGRAAGEERRPRRPGGDAPRAGAPAGRRDGARGDRGGGRGIPVPARPALRGAGASGDHRLLRGGRRRPGGRQRRPNPRRRGPCSAPSAATTTCTTSSPPPPPRPSPTTASRRRWEPDDKTLRVLRRSLIYYVDDPATRMS